MKTAVITDTNSGITKEEAEQLGIFLIPMPVLIDGEVHYEAIDLTEEHFYKALTEGKNLTTSQPSPGEVLDLWEELLKDGRYDGVVYIPMSSGLSTSCATALSLAEEYEGKVAVADCHRISVTMRMSVMEAKAMADNGASPAEIKKALEDAAYDSSIYVAVDTLEYLKKGGRVTPAAAAIGMVLNLKPVLTIQGERLDAFAKVRGMKKAKQKMVDALKKDLDTRFQNIDPSRIRLGAAGAGLSAEDAEAWRKALADAFPAFDVYYDPLGFSIACHTGPGAYGCGLSIVQNADIQAK